MLTFGISSVSSMPQTEQTLVRMPQARTVASVMVDQSPKLCCSGST